MEYAKSKGIQVFNAPGLNANAVAELTISKMLETFPVGTFTANYDVKYNHEWDKYKFEGRELRGKTLGIMGFGRIGQRVGELGRAFKMNIVAYDPFLPDDVFKQQCATKASIDELIKVADFISIHVPLTPETKNLFNKKSIAEMKDGAVVLNMSRGGIVNEADMYEALKEGQNRRLCSRRYGERACRQRQQVTIHSQARCSSAITSSYPRTSVLSL